jgi:ankyrin repeat protein
MEKLNKIFIEEVKNSNLENVEFGANVNFQNKVGDTALILASKNGYTNVVKTLLNKNADVNFQNKVGGYSINVCFTKWLY